MRVFNLVKSLADLNVMIQVPCSDNPERFWQGTGKVDDVFICLQKTAHALAKNVKPQNLTKKR
jgi:hypothetical protein